MQGINKVGGLILVLALGALVLVGLTTPTGSAIGGGAKGIGSGILSGIGTGAQKVGPVSGGRAITIGAVVALAMIMLLKARAGVAAAVGVGVAAVLYVPSLPSQIQNGTVTGNLVTTTRPAATTSCDSLVAAENRASAATAGTAANSPQRIKALAAENARLRAGC